VDLALFEKKTAKRLQGFSCGLLGGGVKSDHFARNYIMAKSEKRLNLEHTRTGRKLASYLQRKQ